MKLINKILYLLSHREKKEAIFLLFMILIMAFLDTLGVASILPFMAIVSNPDIIDTNTFLKFLFQTSTIVGVKTKLQFLFASGVLVLILLIVSLSFKAFTVFLQVRFSQMRQYSISKRLVEAYLGQPYSWFLNRHSAELSKTILSEIPNVVGSGIRPFIDLIAKGMVAFLIILLLIIADPKLAIIIGTSLGGSYTLIFFLVRSYLLKIGKERLKNNKLRFMSVNEAFGASKEIKVGGLEQVFIKRFSNSAKIIALNNSHSSFLSQIPRFALEAIAFGGIILLMLYLMSQTGSLNNALPIISLYVFAGYRLMPALQQIYVSFTQLAFIESSLDKLYNEIKNLKINHLSRVQNTLTFDKKIKLNNIQFSYPLTEKQTLKNINIEINAKTTIGLVGTTGSGKTTTVDILLGLLEAQTGSLEIDGKIITNKNLRSWQSLIGYVPQQIFLSDDNVAANIAFGVNPMDINQKMVERVSKIANLHEFIINDLPNKYHTTIGERGVRLSGGQRQRIGIARALYHSPKVLILDEATNALDSLTEKAVMDAVNNLDKNITIIIIAHRLSMLKKCDNIFMIEKGQIKHQGKFEDLTKINENFRLAALNK